MLGAQQPKFDFTIKNIMRGPEVYGREPRSVRWSRRRSVDLLPVADARLGLARPAVALIACAHRPGQARARHRRADGRGRAVVDNGRCIRPIARSRSSSSDGDLFIVDLKASTVRRLTETVAPETDARFSPTAQRRIRARQQRVLLEVALDGADRQLTDIRTPADAGRSGGAAPVAVVAEAEDVAEARTSLPRSRAAAAERNDATQHARDGSSASSSSVIRDRSATTPSAAPRSVTTRRAARDR